MAKLDGRAIWAILKELRAAAEGMRPLAVSGVLAEQLAKELRRGGDPSAVRVDGPVDGAAVLVRVLAGEPTEDDRQALRAAHRAGVPVVAVQTGGSALDVPYVLATDVVLCPPGAGFPVDEIARAVAARLSPAGVELSARLPALREAVSRELIESFSRKNGIAGAAVFIPGADFPLLTLNQLRLVLRLGVAHGVEIDQQRLPEILATLGAGFGFRAVGRRLATTIPVASWVVKGAVAYAGTRAVGEAAYRYFETVAPPDSAA
jgi:uncharacterized protein (DUF697 family)